MAPASMKASFTVLPASWIEHRLARGRRRDGLHLLGEADHVLVVVRVALRRHLDAGLAACACKRLQALRAVSAMVTREACSESRIVDTCLSGGISRRRPLPDCGGGRRAWWQVRRRCAHRRPRCRYALRGACNSAAAAVIAATSSSSVGASRARLGSGPGRAPPCPRDAASFGPDPRARGSTASSPGRPRAAWRAGPRSGRPRRGRARGR